MWKGAVKDSLNCTETSPSNQSEEVKPCFSRTDTNKYNFDITLVMTHQSKAFSYVVLYHLSPAHVYRLSSSIFDAGQRQIEKVSDLLKKILLKPNIWRFWSDRTQTAHISIQFTHASQQRWTHHRRITAKLQMVVIGSQK